MLSQQRPQPNQNTNGQVRKQLLVQSKDIRSINKNKHRIYTFLISFKCDYKYQNDKTMKENFKDNANEFLLRTENP